MTVDYEQYARERPIFWGDVEYPRVFRDAVSECSGTYVDVGAGDGGQIRSALDQGFLRAFSRVVAADISEERVARIRELMPEIEAVVADAQALPFADGSIDFVYSSQVIEHVPDDAAMAREIRRVLKPGGVAVIGSALRLPGAWYYYRCNGKWVLDPTHVREYESVQEYNQVFESAGLVVETHEIEPIRYAMTDLFVRAMLRLRFMRAGNASSIYQRNALFRRARSWRIAVPRYRHIFSQVRKPLR
jgi:ubiquinone/menaquinone biosynthesis C-methylase UbiE